MTAVEGIVRARQSLPARIASRAGGGALRVFLILVALFWLMPTVGLLLSSLRSPRRHRRRPAGGRSFTDPSQLTFNNYSSLLDNSTITHSLLNTVLITVPATVLVVLLGIAGRLRVRLDGLPGPGLVVHGRGRPAGGADPGRR